MAFRITILKTFLILGLVLPGIGVSAQKQTAHNNQYWFGYMTSAKLSDKYSLWNDAHFVPGAFAIVRTGLTRNIFGKGTLTGGYAYAKLPFGSDNVLKRTEHRPWAQAYFASTPAQSWTLSQRIRYDARYRQRIEETGLSDGYLFNHRVRFLVSLRRNINKPRQGGDIYYAVLSNEILLNFGNQVIQTFDQNRISLGVGLERKKTQYQIGLMNRYVQRSASQYVQNHTLVVWVTQKLDFTRKVSPAAGTLSD